METNDVGREQKCRSSRVDELYGASLIDTSRGVKRKGDLAGLVGDARAGDTAVTPSTEAVIKRHRMRGTRVSRHEASEAVLGELAESRHWTEGMVRRGMSVIEMNCLKRDTKEEDTMSPVCRRTPYIAARHGTTTKWSYAVNCRRWRREMARSMTSETGTRSDHC